MIESDTSFVIYSWLASHRSSPDGLAMKAHCDKEAHKRYWLGQERVAQRLVERCTVTIAEAEIDGTPVIVGYVVGEPNLEIPVLHYVLTRRKMFRLGAATDLLMPYLEADRVLYSHRPSTRGLPIPENWAYDPYTALRHLA